MPHRGLHLALTLALLLFSWTQLAHATDLDAHSGDESCGVCLFASPLGHGATPAALPVLSRPDAGAAPLPIPAAAILPQTFRHTLGQRGPPQHS